MAEGGADAGPGEGAVAVVAVQDGCGVSTSALGWWSVGEGFQVGSQDAVAGDDEAELPAEGVVCVDEVSGEELGEVFGGQGAVEAGAVVFLVVEECVPAVSGA